MMTLDEEVLTEARSLREQLLESERTLEHLRADYQHAIRLLHARGGSMREIAEALSLSHQRVHQIVGAEDDDPRASRRHGPPGRGPFRGMLARFTDAARAAVDAATAEARALGHGSVEAEHLLLALAGEEPLQRAVGDVDALRGRVAGRFPQGEPRRGRIRFGHSARRALMRGFHDAHERGDSRVGTEHLLRALAADDETLAAAGIDAERLRAELGQQAA